MHCNICFTGFFIWKGYEHIPATNSESEPVIEIHSCFECNNCGELRHALIETIPELSQIETAKKICNEAVDGNEEPVQCPGCGDFCTEPIGFNDGYQCERCGEIFEE